ncbi:hypothetical protein GOBAR_DD08477 [Gossypium barbadense]|nr:hypothetical protein GOBAR_DD08477 [Gossypium barbadense]
MDSLYGSSGNRENLPGDLNTKKKDMVLGKGFTESKESSTVHSTNGDFSLLKGDVKKSVINGILAIDFSNRIQKLLMSTSVILKLLGMNIDVVALQNKVYML